MIVANELEYSNYVSQRDKLQSKILEVYKLKSESQEYVIDELFWMNERMVDLLNLMLSVKHYNNVVGSDIEYITKVCKISNSIDKGFLDYKNVNYVFFSGFYIPLDLCYIPADLFSKATRGHGKDWIFSPEMYGLPSNSKVKYSTMKKVGSYYVVVAKTLSNLPILSNIITYTHYTIL